ncbi:hypothetical protein NPIL_233631 [Nephila pilipes]|uniref:Uncharacterized protein n=1 Tax=Nephila pilipes TaxID=299642 RepID=A0A8X6PTR9_NEPPI|nr:hypothetical protein NPIL_233631 [Nephila pilipes]
MNVSEGEDAIVKRHCLLIVCTMFYPPLLSNERAFSLPLSFLERGQIPENLREGCHKNFFAFSFVEVALGFSTPLAPRSRACSRPFLGEAPATAKAR